MKYDNDSNVAASAADRTSSPTSLTNTILAWAAAAIAPLTRLFRPTVPSEVRALRLEHYSSKPVTPPGTRRRRKPDGAGPDPTRVSEGSSMDAASMQDGS